MNSSLNELMRGYEPTECLILVWLCYHASVAWAKIALLSISKKYLGMLEL
jgi:hypothetical protein